MAADNAIEIEVVVAERTELADAIVGLTLRAADGGELPSWRPGAHIDLLFGDVLRGDGGDGGVVRRYSLCGDPGDGAWRIGVLKEGVGSTIVHERVRPGDRLRTRGPRDGFVFEDAPRYLFLAGGIGITPILPMVAAAEAAGADWRLVYGGRTLSAMAFLDELARYGDRVEVRPQDEFGLLDLDAALGAVEPGTLVYCCGPEPMIAAVEERRPGVRTERFMARPDTGPRDAFEVELALSGRTVEVPAGSSILEAVEKAGVNVLFSCREGTCGTCETPVLEGDPDHRDSVLTEEERAEGGFMMICVSRSRGPRLVLEL
ncbi:PDR/VanB family oxidoreductase [Actinomadura algeriensis]|uniref:Ferredoxin-NADP reductase n=1 Tax=Actinomadura algeriensis TaxID=1679523 RepID=A0ABR9JY27_9ACTN|nr:PDR/VanB family oxidoreductase [Actinomadura algeriensis]MBE1535477.1 ferredoxin-NADP reductase [Actinomadura algeriensis]